MKVEWRTEPQSRAVLEIDVPEDEVARAMDEAYAWLARRVQVPGFRPGKAPRTILERHVGTETLREEALRRLVPQQFAEAVRQAGLDPLSRPSIEVKEGPDGKGIHLTAVVDVFPKVELPDYRALRVPREGHAVTDADVDRVLEDIRARHGRLVSTAGGAARRGDFVLLTVVAAPDGAERLQPGKEMLAEIGGGLLPAPVEAALEGARAGEERTAELEGAGAVTVRVADVRRKDLPALDDAFARAVSDQPTLAALRDRLRERLAEERAQEEERALRERVLDAVLAATHIDLPESLVQHEVDHMMEDLGDRLRSRGLTLESYLRTSRKDEVEVRAEMRPAAERRVRARLLLEAVASREGLRVGEEEMAAEVEKLAGELQQDVPKVRAWLAERGRSEGLRESVLRRKAMTLLVEIVAGPRADADPPAGVAGDAGQTAGGATPSP